ncbi:MAG: hypothetical protein JNL90_15320 [Planctomycetes bacterium]|nr:hypothetical protein [Planctomycetota bacterium]
MRRWLLVAGAVVLLGGGLRAQDSLDKIQKEANLALARGAKNGPDLEEIERLVGRARDLSIDQKGEEGGLAAAQWVLNLASFLSEERQSELFAETMDAIVESWLDHDGLAEVVLTRLANPPPFLAKAAGEYFDWIARDSKSKPVQAACKYTAATKEAANAGSVAEAKKMVAKLEKLKAEIGTLPAAFGQTYAQMLDELIDGLKVVGTPAQEIAGKDLDGVAFKLSDYKGKVVLLDFWGYW